MSLTIESGVYNQQIKTNIDYIFKNSILYDKLWEHDICEKICTFIEDGTDFIDIGANIGLITLGVKICLKNKKISKFHCVECDIDNFISLKFNTSIHSDIISYNFALADKPQLCNMSVNDYNNVCNIINTSYTDEKITTYDYTHINNGFKTNSNIFISAISLDSISYIFTNKVSVIKIDVEGHGYEVLEGLGSKLKDVRAIQIETEERVCFENQKIDSMVNKYLLDMGFSLVNKKRCWDLQFDCLYVNRK
jgi:FkbM family methyltransferase